MIEYPKINSIYKRDDKGIFLEGEFSQPEFEYLSLNQWEATEKIDGTNIRVEWDTNKVTFGGKTNNAQTPTFLLTRLQELFPIEKFKTLYPDLSITLYGEGYGAKIQSGGKYISNGCDFILFDILIEGWWIRREDILDIAGKLQIKTVPFLGKINLYDAICKTKKDFASSLGNCQAEGLVLKPLEELRDRKNRRIITKIKCKDWK